MFNLLQNMQKKNNVPIKKTETNLPKPSIDNGVKNPQLNPFIKRNVFQKREETPVVIQPEFTNSSTTIEQEGDYADEGEFTETIKNTKYLETPKEIQPGQSVVKKIKPNEPTNPQIKTHSVIVEEKQKKSSNPLFVKKNIEPSKHNNTLNGENHQEQPKRKKLKESEKYELWTEEHKLLSIDPPSSLSDNAKITNLRYKISFRYFDPPSRRIKRKTIRFGKTDQEYFIDNGDTYKRKKLLAKFKGYYTPFHKNFWVTGLLCTENDIQTAYKKLRENYID